MLYPFRPMPVENIDAIRPYFGNIMRRLRFFLGNALIFLAAACGSDQPSSRELAEGFVGGVAADEPLAALNGREILLAGGSAADAAVTTALSMAVGLPSSTGLGGGGSCVVFNANPLRAELIDFSANMTAGGRIGIPATVRGLATLHARYGRLPWAQAVAPAEAMARFGHPMSRALAREMSSMPESLKADAEARRVFFRPDGQPLGEGETLTQPDLAGVLGQIRVRGAGEFYGGGLARSIVEAANGDFLAAELRAYVPTMAEPPRSAFEDGELLTTTNPVLGGTLLSRLLGVMTEGRRYAASSPAERAHFVVEAQRRIESELRSDIANGARSLPATVSKDRIQALLAAYRPDRRSEGETVRAVVEAPDAGAASFVAADRQGSVIACALTMNAPWGVGRMLPNVGILVASPPTLDGPVAVGAIYASLRSGRSYFAGAASGGPAAAPVLARLVLSLAQDKQRLAQALEQPRVAYGSVGDLAMYETSLAEPLRNALAQRGHGLRPLPTLARVNAIWCTDDLARNPTTCSGATDRRGFGLFAGGSK
jgi:gamma-glutamyltranspeptidase/glutathione hydrolase